MDLYIVLALGALVSAMKDAAVMCGGCEVIL